MDDYSEADSDGEFRLIQWQGLSDLFMTCFIVAVSLIPILWYIAVPKNRVPEAGPIGEGIIMARVREPVNEMREALGNQPPLRNTQPPLEILKGLDETSVEVISRLAAFRAVDNASPEKLGLIAAENDRLKKENEALLAKIKSYELASRERTMIPIVEGKTEQFRFKSGEAVLSPEWLRNLSAENGGFDQVATLIRNRKGNLVTDVDTLLVIGHTDGQPVDAGSSNLDGRIFDCLQPGAGPEQLQPGSNTDLGLMRAMAVANAWSKYAAAQPDASALSAIRVRFLSAGATDPVDSRWLSDRTEFTKRHDESRRMELRLIRN